ncbi:MAG TPA: hypothetical protein VL461_11180 [Dictyobacter sp.]|jgi:hypothetical protein|nr:hypothetical protein [Dictyobacter sp.]
MMNYNEDQELQVSGLDYPTPRFIQLPDNYPQPRFTFGQEVYLKNTENMKGIIAVMQCASSSPWEYRPWEWRYMLFIPAINILETWFGEDELSFERWPS